MEFSKELEALRCEQRALREALDRIERRIDVLALADSRDPDPETVSAPVLPPGESRAEVLRPPIADEFPMEELPAPPLPAEPASTTPEPLKIPASFAEPQPATNPPAAAAPPVESLELRVGRVWLVRLGIAILLTGFVFLGNYAYHEFIGRIGPIGKLLLIYLAGGGLCGIGAWLARGRESLKNYARVVMAGGCATIYYATYAAHFVASLRVLESPVAAGLLLLGLGGGFVALANRLRSQTLAAATIALTYYVSAINPIGTFSLFSNLVISATAITLLARRHWPSVSFLSLTGAYGSFAFWRFHQGDVFSVPAGAFWPAILFPAAYWLTHTAAVMLRRIDSLDPGTRPAFLTLNNAAFFGLASPVIAGMHPEWFWIATAIYGAMLVALSLVAARRCAEEAWFDGAYLAQGLGLLLLAALYKFTGWQQAISFALLAATLISLGRFRHGGILRFFAGASALVSAISAAGLFFDASPHARLTASAAAAILALGAILLKRQFGGSCDWRSLGFSFLAAALALPVCLDENLETSAIRIFAVALAAFATARPLRIAEFAYAAQPLAVCAQALLLVHAALHDAPASALVISAGFALVNVHLWQWEHSTRIAGRVFFQPLHLVAPVALAIWSVAEHVPIAWQGAALALTAIAILGYGTVTRVRALQVAGTAFTLASILFASRSANMPATCLGNAIAAVLLVIQSLLLPRLTAQPLPAITLRLCALLLGMALAFIHANSAFLFPIFTGAALAAFTGASLRRNRELGVHAALLLGAAGLSWTTQLVSSSVQPLDIAGFAAIALIQQIGKRRLADCPWFPAPLQTFLCTVATLGIWITAHRWVAPSAGGFLLTISWSLVALLVMSAGFLLRERAYRILGLVILAAAIGRIFCIDVWQLETLHRILSFLVLGVILLLLGFLYNRFADTVRRWL